MGQINDFFLIDITNSPAYGPMNDELLQRKNGFNIFMKLLKYALYRYGIETDSENISDRVVLESFIFYGECTFFEYMGSYFALPGGPGGAGFNLNGEPLSANVYSRNGVLTMEMPLYVKGGNIPIMNQGTGGYVPNKDAKGVMIWEDKTRYPIAQSMVYYAAMIADAMDSIDVDKTWLTLPSVPVVPEKLVNPVMRVFDEIKKKKKIIPVGKGLSDAKQFEFYPGGDVPGYIRSGIELCEWYTNQFLSDCYYNHNSAVDKRGENITTDEIHMGDDETRYFYDKMMDGLDAQADFANEKLPGLGLKFIRRERQDDTEISDIRDMEGNTPVPGGDTE